MQLDTEKAYDHVNWEFILISKYDETAGLWGEMDQLDQVLHFHCEFAVLFTIRKEKASTCSNGRTSSEAKEGRFGHQKP